MKKLEQDTLSSASPSHHGMGPDSYDLIHIIEVLRSQMESKGEFSQLLWQKLLLDFPDKAMLFQLKDADFDMSILRESPQESSQDYLEMNLFSDQIGQELSVESDIKSFDDTMVFEDEIISPVEEHRSIEQVHSEHISDEPLQSSPAVDFSEMVHLNFILEPRDYIAGSPKDALYSDPDSLVQEKPEPDIDWMDILHMNFIYSMNTQSDELLMQAEESHDEFKMNFEDWKQMTHLSFIYEMVQQQLPIGYEFTDKTSEKPVEEPLSFISANHDIEKSDQQSHLSEVKHIEAQKEDPTALLVENSGDASFVAWLKRISEGTGFAESALELSAGEKENEKKKDQKRRAKTAKKLLKKSKKAEKKNKEKKNGSKKKKDQISEIVEGSVRESEEFITETYADLLANQGYLEKSIQMYEALMLRNPEKSSFFAAKIQKLKNK